MYVGIDVGGTKVEFCRFDQNYKVVAQTKLGTETLQPGSPIFWTLFTQAVSAFVTGQDQRVGIAMKGIIHEQQIVYSSLLGGAVHEPLAAQLSELLDKPVRVDNDIRPLARAERRFGQAQGVRSFSIVNLGTGLGIVNVDGDIQRGYKSVAGEVDQVTCWVKQLERFETFQNLISGAGIAALYQEMYGRVLSAQEIFSSAQRDNRDAQLVVDICVQSLAHFLSYVSCFYNPELVIIHGSMRHSLRYRASRLASKFGEMTDPLSRPRSIVFSNLENAACLGAIIA